MKYLWSSPCSRHGLTSGDEPFPCLDPSWGGRDCPMNAAEGMSLGSQESDMYRLGYPYGAWVVRMDPLGLSPVCSLTYFREKPSQEDLHALYGDRVLRVCQAGPRPARGGPESPLDHEVVAAAAR